MCLVVLTTIAVAAALHWLAPAMIPFTLAVLFSFILSPLISLQESRLHVPRGVAVAATLVIAFLVFGGVATLISASVGQLAANAAGYQQKVTAVLRLGVSSLPLAELGIEEAAVYDPIRKYALGTVGSLLMGTTNAVVEILSNGVLVLVFMVFLLLGSRERPPRPDDTWSRAEAQIKRYLVAKGVLSAITGGLVGAVLSLLGVDLALVFGLFAFLLNFIPSIGSIIATLLPLPVVIASPGITPLVAVLAIAIPGAIQFAIGNLVEPRLMGRSLDLHPVAIILNLIIWGMLWGVVGMLLSTPILVVIRIVCEKAEGTRPLALILAGRIDELRG